MELTLFGFNKELVFQKVLEYQTDMFSVSLPIRGEDRDIVLIDGPWPLLVVRTQWR